jgi:hypothetical protein
MFQLMSALSNSIMPAIGTHFPNLDTIRVGPATAANENKREVRFDPILFYDNQKQLLTSQYSALTVNGCGPNLNVKIINDRGKTCGVVG